MIILLLTIFFSFLSGKLFLKFLTSRKIIQPIYEDAPTIHALKAGTPTMGGVTFILPLILLTFICLLFLGSKLLTLSLLIVIVGFFLIGFKDDFLKVTKKRNDFGFTPTQKLFLQFITAILSVLVLYISGIDSKILLFDYQLDFGLLYFVLMAVVMVGFSNATNLTDGLDGLLTSVSIIIFGTLFIVSIYNNEPIELSIFILMFTGLLIGFLINNKFPAKMFMGDTGSLVIGAVFTLLIIAMKIEVLGVFLGLIYIVEMLSVMFQVGYFKYTRKRFGEGRRILKMAPLHHHFEQGGTKEKVITIYFVIAQLIISTIILSFM